MEAVHTLSFDKNKGQIHPLGGHELHGKATADNFIQTLYQTCTSYGYV
jgi:hypothetical protein